MSLTWNVTNFVLKTKENEEKDKIEADEVKKQDILKPIAPPKYYATIEARRRNVKTGPYTVEAMAESLKNDLIPVGYSLEQLRKVGFGADVTEYERRKKENNKKNKQDLIDALEKLKKELEKGIVSQEDLSEEDKELIKKNDIFNPVQRAKYIAKLNSWIELAKKDVLGDDVLTNMLKVLNYRIDDYQDAIKDQQLRKQNQELVDNAVLNRDKKVLDSVKRAFKNGFLY